MTAAVALGERSPDIRASAMAAVWIGFAVLAVASFALPDGTDSGLDARGAAAMAARIGHGHLQFHEMAGGRRDLRPVHLQRGDARDQRLSQCAAHGRNRDLLDGTSARAAARQPCSLRRHCRGLPSLGSRRRSAIASGATRSLCWREAAFLYLAVFGQWASAMTTLASIAIAVPLGVAGGVLFGHPRLSLSRFARRIMEPILDLMQTVPIFAYLIPILFLFGFGPVSALIATMIYAMPPMVRVTMTRARGRADARSSSTAPWPARTRRQMLLKVMLPAARPQLLVGVNQVIMLSLNMVIIASMIGAGGLGYDVLTSLRRLDIGRGLEAGLAIVVLAIALDRLSQAYASQPADRPGCRAGRFVIARSRVHGRSSMCSGCSFRPWRPIPRRCSFRPRRGGARRSGGSTCIFFDTMDAIKSALLLNVLIPIKRFMVAQTWLLVTAALGFAGWRLGGTATCGARGGPCAVHRLQRAVGKGDGERLSGRDLGHRRIGHRHSARHPGRSLRPRLARARGRYRHAADPAELRLPDTGGDAVQGRRFHRHDRHRALCSGAGRTLHRARHSQRSAHADRGRHGGRLHASASS